MLHHDDYHHRFYDFLGAGGERLVKELAAAWTGERPEPPKAAASAFSNWPTISRKLHELFERAPKEAVTDTETAWAHMALKAVDDPGYPEEIAAKVRKKANAIIVACAARDRERIGAALAEPKRLLVRLDEFVGPVGARKEPASAYDAEMHVRQFLDDCRKFDRALSAIPSKLREGSPNASRAGDI